jgi:hypothetical protein
MDKKARELRYEKCGSALLYYYQMLELLGKMKINDNDKILMYLLGGLPREVVKQLHLLNLKDPEDVRNYLVKYEQLESYLPPLEDASKVNAVVATVHQYNPQSNRSRGNYNNKYRGRGNNNRGNFNNWNQQGYPRQAVPSAQGSYNPQTHSLGYDIILGAPFFNKYNTLLDFKRKQRRIPSFAVSIFDTVQEARASLPPV